MRAEEFVKVDAGLAVPAPPNGPDRPVAPADLISRQRVLMFVEQAAAFWGWSPIAAEALSGVRDAVTEEPGA